MKPLHTRNSFKKDLKRIQKRHWDLHKLRQILAILQSGTTLPDAARLHKLSGEYEGLWECHIESDWLLVFDITDEEVTLWRTGTHADLFE